MLAKLFVTIFFLHQHACQLLIDVYYTESTDISLKLSISSTIKQNFPQQVELNDIFINSNLNFIPKPELNAILDLTFSISISQALKDFSNQNNLILISLSNNYESYSNWQYFTHFMSKYHINVLSSLVSLMGWEKFIIIYDEDSSQICSSLKEEPLFKESLSYYLRNDENQTYSDNFVGQKIKSAGIRNVVILNQGKSAEKLLNSLSKLNMMVNGTGIILGSQSWWGANDNELIGYIESGLENAIDKSSYESLACVKLIKLMLEFSGSNDNLNLRKFLEQNTINHHLPPKFTLINSYNSQKNIVGTIYNGTLETNNTLIFPGNSLSIPNSPTTQINIWIADGVTNPGGFPNSVLTNLLKYGAHYALYLSTKNHFLEGFEYIVTHTDCGAEVFIPDFAIECFSKLKNNIGVAYLPSPFPGPIFGTISSLKTLNISMPIVSDYSTPGSLGIKDDFPLFMRIAGYDLYHTSVLANLINIFGWKKIILICENSTDNVPVYNYLVEWADAYKVEIVNSPEDRWVMWNYNSLLYDDVKDWMQRIVSLKTRPILYFVTPPSEWFLIIDFYKAGLRPEDTIFLFPNRVAYAQVLVSDPTELQIFLDFMYGSIIINEAEWIGNYGQEIWKGFLEYYYPFNIGDFKCLSFDAAILTLHAIKYTLNKGENINNATVMNLSLRQQRFLGCSGSVSIESWSNNRNSAILGIYNMRWNQNVSMIYESLCGIYDLGSELLFTFTDNIIWHNNKTTIPEDTIYFDIDCPFYKRQIEFSAKGASIFYSFCVFFDAIAIIISYYLLNRWQNYEIPRLTTPSKANFEDYMDMGIIFIEFLQYLSMGPDLKGYDRFVNYFSDLAAINFDWIVSKEKLWIYIGFALIMVFIWVFLVIENIFNCVGKMAFFLWKNIKTLSLLMFPIIGNICFMPIISIFLSSFACYQSIGSDLTQSFVHQDCYTFCWKNEHIIWACFSIFVLLIYIPLAIYSRPMIDFFTVKTVKAKPAFFILKSIFQINVVILNKVMIAYYEGLYGFVYVTMMIIFLYLCAKKKPYNYDRMNLWLIISYLCAIWGISVSSVYNLYSYNLIYVWIICQYGGWAILVAAGLWIQSKYYPSLLVAEAPTDIGVLFRFELGKSVKADTINQSNREKLKNKYSMNILYFASFANIF